MFKIVLCNRNKMDVVELRSRRAAYMRNYRAVQKVELNRLRSFFRDSGRIVGADLAGVDDISRIQGLSPMMGIEANAGPHSEDGAC